MVEKTTYPTLNQPEGLSEGAAVKALPAKAGGPVRVEDNGNYTPTTYSNYLFGRAGQNDHPLWSDSTKGRIAIRMVSRGIFGSLAFAWGSIASKKALQHYEPGNWREADESLVRAVYSKPLKALAQGIDSTLGRAIQKTAKVLAPAGQEELWANEATRFRSKAYYHQTTTGHDTGRSLGAEMVDVTFNFAAASVADATVRNIAQGIDPHNKKKWLVDENGQPATHGRFVFSEWAKAVGGASWRIFSKNQGEDWAAALPYVYQMKWQRQAIANHSPNFKLSADNHLHGASLLVNKQGEVVGDLMKAGALDLHMRFVGYNWYTLMYRETYDMIGYQLGQWKKNHYQLGLPEIGNPITAATNAVGSAGRYVMKSFIKSNIYMQPAMFFFWPMRVAQSRPGAGAIVVDSNPQENAFVTKHSMTADIKKLAAENGITGTYQQKLDKIVPVMHASYHKNGVPEYEYRYQTAGSGIKARIGTDKELWAGNTRISPHSDLGRAKTPFDAHLQKTTFSKVLNPLGKLSWHTGNRLNKVFNPSNSAGRAELLSSAGNAFWSYTPYMAAKAEFAYRVDERPNGHTLGAMDKAIYRFIDNAFTFNIKGMGQAVGDIAYHAVRTKEHLSGREGGNDVEAPISSTEPTSVVQVKTVQKQQTATPLPPALAANDNGANDNGERSWADAVGKSAERMPQALSTALH